MDRKTEELRDIFMDVAEGETVTEAQEESRGSLADRGDVGQRLSDVVDGMCERYAFRANLDEEELCALVRGFYDGETDAELARTLDVSRHTVFRARMDLHLLRESDLDAPFDLDVLRDRLADDDPLTEVADDLDVSASTVRRYRDALAARNESRGANDRYRGEFDSILADSDLTGGLTDDVKNDGLEDATEDAEVDVSF
jgi:DNA-binding CsgD family transcriptional regulator